MAWRLSEKVIEDDLYLIGILKFLLSENGMQTLGFRNKDV